MMEMQTGITLCPGSLHTMASFQPPDRSPAQGFRKASQTELSVFRLIHAYPRISRVELAERSGLSTAAITGIVNVLLSRNLLLENRESAGGTGRKRISLIVRPGLAYIAGIDIGTINLRICITDLNGFVLASKRWRSDMSEGRAAVLAHVFASLRVLLREAGLVEAQLKGIGIGFSGVIDVEKGLILSYPRPGQLEQWKNTPLREIAENDFKVPVVLEDSVRAVAIMEKLSGHGCDYTNFVYVDVGVGVGSAIFIDGKLYRGHGGGAGEFGHITVDEDGPLCCCGNNGCLEAVASGAAIIEDVRNAIRRGVATKITGAAGYATGELTLEMIAAAAAADDTLANRILSEAALHIGTAAASLVNLLNPAAILFGGALFRAAPEFLITRIRSAIRHRAMEKAVSDAVIQASSLNEDAGAHGAAKLMATHLIDCIYRTALSDRSDSRHSANARDAEPGDGTGSPRQH